MKKELILGLGRLNRIRFLAYSNIVYLLAITVLLITDYFFSASYKNYIQLFLGLIALLLSLKPVIQRYHDVNASGWWSILYLTPGSPIIFLLLAFTPGDKTENKYGKPNPSNNIVVKLLAIVPLVLYIVLILLFYTWINSYL